MNEQKLFRRVSLERVSSPEQLNQYIQVSNPSMWLLLSAIIVLLVAVCIWGVVGRLETALSVKALVIDGQALCLLEEKQHERVKSGMVVRVGEVTGTVLWSPDTPSSYESLQTRVGEYNLYASGMVQGSWRYPVQVILALPDGVYDAQIIIDSVSPLSFLVN